MSSVMVNGTRIETVRGDISCEQVDAVVNAANRTLLGGGGVDGAIHRGAGPELLAECKALNGCDTGDAKMTRGYRLPAKHIIHTVGPVYSESGPNAARRLASCHRRSMEIAIEHGLKSVAFPAISCGVYGYPVDEAAHVAANTVVEFVTEHPGLELVRFVLFNDEALRAFSAQIERAAGAGGHTP
jgi:O-acetyl-ADP-ribose deacetylase (regulator of RNase III)